MKIYNGAHLMELSKREVTLTMKRSHHDLIFILIGKKKNLCEEPCKCCCEKRLTIKKQGKGKHRAQEGFFLQRITAELRDNVVHKEIVSLV